MRNYSILLLLLMWSHALPAQTLLVLGDSLSAGYGLPAEQGWVRLLEQRLQDQHSGVQVVNASVSGETSAGGLARLPVLLERHQPEWVLLQLGANDALRGTPLPIIEQQLDALITAIAEHGSQTLLVGIRIPPNYGPQYTEGFFNLSATLADRHQLVLVPFLLEGVALDWSLMQSDGLHPNAEAQPRLLDTVWPYLEPVLLRSESMK